MRQWRQGNGRRRNAEQPNQRTHNKAVQAALMIAACFWIIACEPPITVSPDNRGTGIYYRENGSVMAVEYSVETFEGQELAIYQGDIILGTLDELQHRPIVDDPAAGAVPPPDIGEIRLGASAFDPSRLWPNAILPYSITPEIPAVLAERVRNAAERVTLDTGLQVVERTAENAHLHPHFVTVQFSDQVDNCRATIGYGVRFPRMILGMGCAELSIVHEFFHNAGLYHEQSRSDRDQFVRIIWDNILPEFVEQFRTYREQGYSGEDTAVPYNYDSLMHYSSRAFAIDGTQPTIIPIDENGNDNPEQFIGQRYRMSEGDVASINEIYHVTATVTEVYAYFNNTFEDRALSTLRFPDGIFGYRLQLPTPVFRVDTVPKPELGLVPIFTYLRTDQLCIDFAFSPLNTDNFLGWLNKNVAFYASPVETDSHSVPVYQYFDAERCDFSYTERADHSFLGENQGIVFWVRPHL